MKVRIGLLLQFCFFISQGYSQQLPLVLAWSPANNKCVLPFDKKSSVFGQIENNFLLPQLSKATVLYAGNIKGQMLFGELQRKGYRQFNATTFLAGTVKQLTDNLKISAGAGLIRVCIPDAIISEIIPIIETGIEISLRNNLFISSIAKGINYKSEKTIGTDEISTLIRYKTSRDVALVFGVIKRSEQRRISVLAEFNIHVNTAMLCGRVTTTPMQFFTGYGWKHRDLLLFIGMDYHPLLGVSPVVSSVWSDS